MDFTRVRHTLLPTAPHITDYRHPAPPLRPVWRGRQHALALILLTPILTWITIVCFMRTNHPMALIKIPVLLYALSLIAVLAISASYHLAARTPRSQAVMQRLDRATIYLLIAGTTTPVLMTVVYPDHHALALTLLTFTWTVTITGILLRSLNRLPKTSYALYLVLGWMGIIAAPAMWNYNHLVFMLILAGGIVYTLGSITFATHHPDPKPTHYGYHEVFHSCTLGGIALHLSAIALLIIPIAS